MATFHANLVQSFKNFKNKYIGNTSIAGIGDGTLTSAVSTINQHLSNLSCPNYSDATILQAGTTYTATEDVFVSGSAYNNANGAVRITLTVYDASDNEVISIINSGNYTPGSTCGSSVSLPIKKGFKYKFLVDDATISLIKSYKYA